ncbi:39S ribosomal protein L10, mitochondrial [Condylostylus longicornis]|uniref:39S ribosomal protein L10, mitochondrial n=1 Tax=Condylostylus longicornis TaxID=2530218 RepID=UPI00244E2AE0|nr:39S ribosomal protein L10, mitochondrial [Condylostylus longicornis]
MSFMSQKLLCVQLPLLYAKRFRGKINIQRPRQPHYERAKILAVTQPIFPKPDLKKKCFEKNVDALRVNPYDEIIAKEVFNWLNHSKMVGIFHLNSITSDEIFKVKVALHKQNMHLKTYGKKIIGKAVVDTKYEAIYQLFNSNHCFVFSPEEKVSQLVKITRKVPQMILLAGIIQDRLLSRNEFVEYAKLPDLQAMRCELVNVLNMVGNQIITNLESHQKNLINVLDAYAKGENNTNKNIEEDTKV